MKWLQGTKMPFIGNLPENCSKLDLPWLEKIAIAK